MQHAVSFILGAAAFVLAIVVIVQNSGSDSNDGGSSDGNLGLEEFPECDRSEIGPQLGKFRVCTDSTKLDDVINYNTFGSYNIDTPGTSIFCQTSNTLGYFKNLTGFNETVSCAECPTVPQVKNNANVDAGVSNEQWVVDQKCWAPLTALPANTKPANAGDTCRPSWNDLNTSAVIGEPCSVVGQNGVKQGEKMCCSAIYIIEESPHFKWLQGACDPSLQVRVGQKLSQDTDLYCDFKKDGDLLDMGTYVWTKASNRNESAAVNENSPSAARFISNVDCTLKNYLRYGQYPNEQSGYAECLQKTDTKCPSGKYITETACADCNGNEISPKDNFDAICTDCSDPASMLEKYNNSYLLLQPNSAKTECVCQEFKALVHSQGGGTTREITSTRSNFPDTTGKLRYGLTGKDCGTGDKILPDACYNDSSCCFAVPVDDGERYAYRWLWSYSHSAGEGYLDWYNNQGDPGTGAPWFVAKYRDYVTKNTADYTVFEPAGSRQVNGIPGDDDAAYTIQSVSVANTCGCKAWASTQSADPIQEIFYLYSCMDHAPYDDQ